MRDLEKNKTTLYYALYENVTEDVYETDTDGNIIYDDDGDPIIIGSVTKLYGDLVDFSGNIAFSGGEAEAKAYGVSVTDYDSKLVMPKGAIPITETSLIFENEVESASEKTADFHVIKVQPSLNQDVFLLKRITK